MADIGDAVDNDDLPSADTIHVSDFLDIAR